VVEGWPRGSFEIDRHGRVRSSSADPDGDATAEPCEGWSYLERCADLLGRGAVSVREIEAGVRSVRSGERSSWMGLCGFKGEDGRSRWLEITLLGRGEEGVLVARHRVGGADERRPAQLHAPSKRDAGDGRLRLAGGEEDQREAMSSGVPTERVGRADEPREATSEAWDGFSARPTPVRHGLPGDSAFDRERDEAETAASIEDRVRNAVSDQASEVGVVVCDNDGRIAWANAAFLRRSGKDLASSRGRPLETLIAGPRTDVDRLTLLRTRMLQSRPCRVSIIRYGREGRWSWSEFEGKPLERQGAGRVLGEAAPELFDTGQTPQATYVLTEVDVFERKRRDHLAFLSQFSADAAGPPTLWVNHQAGLLYVNESAAAMLGRNRSDLQGGDLRELAPELSGASWQGFWDHLRSTRSIKTEMLFYDAAGQTLHTQVSGSFVALDGAGYACLFIRDVSVERQAERKLATSERRLRLLFEASHDGIVLVHQSGRFVDVNTAACDLLGFDRDRLMGLTVSELEARLWPASVEGRREQHLWPRLISSESFGGEFEFSSAEHSRLVEFTTSPVGEDLYLVVLRDVSDRGRTDAALRQIARGTSAATGERFLKRLTRYLSQALHGDLAAIAMLEEPNATAARVVGSFANGRMIDSFTMDVDSPLFASTATLGAGASPAHVEIGADDAELYGLGMRSGVSLPLFDGAGMVVGVLLVASQATTFNPPSIDAVLQIYGARAGAELERQGAYRQLASSERRYRQLLDQLPDASVVHRDGRVLFANANAAKLLNVAEAGTLIGLDLYEFVHPNDRVRVAERDGLVSDGLEGEGSLLEAKFMTADREQLDVESTATLVQFQGRAATHLVLRDVSKRRHAERTLDRFFKVSPDLLCILTLDGRIVRVNNAFSRLVGLEELDLQSLSLFDLLARGGSTEVRALHGRLRSGQPRTEFIAPLTDVADRVRQLEWSFHPEPHEGLIYGVARDVTLRLEQERTLRKQAQIIDQVHDSVISLDMRGVITSWNPGARRMFGYAADEAVGRHISMLEPATVSGLRRSSFLAPIDDDASHDVEHTLIRRDGRRFLAQTSLSILRDQRQLAVGVIGVSTDISRRKSLEAELRRSQKLEAVGMLSSGIAHDFNNILTAIFTDVRNAERALLNEADAGDALEAVKQIGKAALQAREVTTSLLTFSRGSTPVKKAVNVAQLLHTSADLLRRMLPSNVIMSVEVERDAPMWVHADPAQLQQVVVNLCVNGRDAMPEGGRLVLSARHEPGAGAAAGSVTFSVADTGVGISKEHLDRVFEPFFTTKPRGQGTGLGLAIIHGIVEEHGGKLELQSEIGVGTTISARLPASTPPRLPEVKPEPSRPMGEGLRAWLHAEPRFVCGFILGVLEDLGFAVETVRFGTASGVGDESAESAEITDDGKSESPADVVVVYVQNAAEAERLSPVLRETESGLVLIMASEPEQDADDSAAGADNGAGVDSRSRRKAALAGIENTRRAPCAFVDEPFQADDLAAALETLQLARAATADISRETS